MKSSKLQRLQIIEDNGTHRGHVADAFRSQLDVIEKLRAAAWKPMVQSLSVPY